MNKIYIWIWAFFAGLVLVPALYYCFWAVGMETGSARVLGCLATFGYGVSWLLHGISAAEEGEYDDEGNKSD